MRDDLDNASFGPEHFVWLWKSLLHSVRAVLSTPWAWGPAVGLTVLSIVTQWNEYGWGSLAAVNAAMESKGIALWAPDAVDTFIGSAAAVTDLHIRGIGIVGLFAVFVLLMARGRRIMTEVTEYTPGQVWRTQIVLVLSATAGIIVYGWMYAALISPAGAASLNRMTWAPYYNFVSMAAIPILALFKCVYLSILYERAAGGVLSVRVIARRALSALWPMVIASAIVEAILYMVQVSGWVALSGNAFFIGAAVVSALLFLVPVILIVEQCSLWRALVLNVRFIWTYLWRYIAFVLLACAFLSLPGWIVRRLMGWGTNWCFHPVTDLLMAVLCIIFITLSFRYYIREAGTRDEETA